MRRRPHARSPLRYGIKYPDLYATPENCKDEKARNAFNCVQRAHQNSLENLPSFYALLTLAGLRHPVTAAVCGAVVLVGRIVYFNAYSTGQPDKRMWGAPLIYPPLFTLVGICVKAAIEAFKA